MEHTIYIQIGNKIRALRKAQGLTQGDIGKIIGLSRASVTNIEKGRHKVQLHVLYDISQALHTDLIEIIS
ncbi:helix-turn-helix domain-containing protein [Paenibacillus eucommiae]|uniref:Transcriptional regulator with XRE-family HTH domain n=1 Tax=Paenibacillus eucommiae TaxID=1355755 RepID=A0ABS4IUF5_9BACL|nr:helix-turn-helix transcriptional regulator [Paenibacillus eucommiae]MBP1991188.1 transcriptional regulator with XRE-family HTH domain [Paenibacillus eucommiae]